MDRFRLRTNFKLLDIIINRMKILGENVKHVINSFTSLLIMSYNSIGKHEYPNR